MNCRDPNIIYSGLGGVVTEQGITVELSIHRLEDQPGWAMEVVNQKARRRFGTRYSKPTMSHLLSSDARSSTKA